MDVLEIYRVADLSVFKQIIMGFMNSPSYFRSLNKTPLEIVCNANKIFACTVKSKDEAVSLLNKFDFTVFGYYNNSHAKVKIETKRRSDEFSIVVMPKSIYSLREKIVLPDPPDNNAKVFLLVLSDEYERLKIRAEKVVAYVPAKKKVCAFAFRNIQLARKLFDDARFLFHSIRSNPVDRISESDLYIIYILNLFIIRTIVFYSKFFQPYLKELPVSEKALRDSLHQEMPHVFKYPFLYQQQQARFDTLDFASANSQLSDLLSPYTQKLKDEISKISENEMWELLDLYKLKGCMQLTDNTNILAAQMFEFTNKPLQSGSPLVVCDAPKVSKFISYFSKDKNGILVNPETFNSYMKPSNVKKRPGVPVKSGKTNNTKDTKN